MGWIRTIGLELWGLFVDDGMLALLALVWIVVVGFMPRALSPVLAEGWFGAALLFAGLAVILVASVVRGARRSRLARMSKQG